MFRKNLKALCAAAALLAAQGCANSPTDKVADRVIESDTQEMRVLRAATFLAMLSHVAVRESEGPGGAMASIGLISEASDAIADVHASVYNDCPRHLLEGSTGIDCDPLTVPTGQKLPNGETPTFNLAVPYFFHNRLLPVERSLLKLAKLAVPKDDINRVLESAGSNPLTLLIKAIPVTRESVKVMHILGQTKRDGKELRMELTLNALSRKASTDSSDGSWQSKFDELKSSYRANTGSPKVWQKALDSYLATDQGKSLLLAPIRLQYISAFNIIQYNCARLVLKLENQTDKAAANEHCKMKRLGAQIAAMQESAAGGGTHTTGTSPAPAISRADPEGPASPPS